MEDNRTSSAIAVDKYQEREIEDLKKEMCDFKKEFGDVAKSHVTWTIFWSIIILLCGIVGSAISFNNATIQDHITHDDEEFAELKKGDGGYNTRISVLEEKYSVIINGQAEMKSDLKTIMKEMGIAK